jgi:hypothetical protein
MWLIQMAFLLFTVCTIFLSSLTLRNTSWFLTRSELPSHKQAGLWSRYTKLPTPIPQFLNLRFQLLHKNSICINNGKTTKLLSGIIRHFITTTWIIRLCFRLHTIAKVLKQYLFKTLHRGRSRYIFSDSGSTQKSFRLRLHNPASR